MALNVERKTAVKPKLLDDPSVQAPLDEEKLLGKQLRLEAALDDHGLASDFSTNQELLLLHFLDKAAFKDDKDSLMTTVSRRP